MGTSQEGNTHEDREFRNRLWRVRHRTRHRNCRHAETAHRDDAPIGDRDEVRVKSIFSSAPFLQESRMKRKGEPVSKRIYVGNLPKKMTTDDLKALFGKYGKVGKVEFMVDPKSRLPTTIA